MVACKKMDMALLHLLSHLTRLKKAVQNDPVREAFLFDFALQLILQLPAADKMDAVIQPLFPQILRQPHHKFRVL